MMKIRQLFSPGKANFRRYTPVFQENLKPRPAEKFVDFGRFVNCRMFPIIPA